MKAITTLIIITISHFGFSQNKLKPVWHAGLELSNYRVAYIDQYNDEKTSYDDLFLGAYAALDLEFGNFVSGLSLSQYLTLSAGQVYETPTIPQIYLRYYMINKEERRFGLTAGFGNVLRLYNNIYPNSSAWTIHCSMNIIEHQVMVSPCVHLFLQETSDLGYYSEESNELFFGLSIGYRFSSKKD